MIIRDVEKLRPDFRARYLVGFKFCREVLGIDIRTAETIRDRIRQGEMVAAGLSSNPIGKHEFGYAADFDIFIDGVLQTDDRSGLYLRCGFVFMALGLRWGGNWDRDKNIAEKGESDFRHVEDPLVTLQQLLMESTT